MAVALWGTLSGVAIVACGGGDGTGCGSCAAPTPAQAGAPSTAEVEGTATAMAGVGGTGAAGQPTRQEATRFLTQATFGPTQADVEHVMAVGYQAWLNEQFALPMSTISHVASWDAANVAIVNLNPASRASRGEVTSSFWRQAVTSPDQLRQRVAFALSQIMVVSMADSCGDNAYSRGAADYLDMLGRQAFGRYRDLLGAVAVHPVMGCYLSHIRNQKEDLATGRVPDENFAREVMQLFSIGVYRLNADGSNLLDASQQPVEAYNAADVAGLAKVFTGWSWSCVEGLTDACFFSNPRAPEQYVTAMRGFASFHAISEKNFLGISIPASSGATPEADLAQALDLLSRHANTAPFIGKQLIQRLVTSNPSPAYVARVSSVFKTSGGSLKSVVSAILLDPEARDMTALNSDTFGKVREPILRFSALLRAFDARSASGMFLVTDTTDSGYSLAQSIMWSPSVFSFFRPGYLKPGSSSAAAKLVAPELQIVTETSVAGYLNFMREAIANGAGRNGLDSRATKADVQLDYNVNPSSPWLPMADKPGMLVEEINQRLMYGSMPASLKAEITQAITALDFRAQLMQTPEQVSDTRMHRLWSALLLTVASPEFQVQK